MATKLEIHIHNVDIVMRRIRSIGGGAANYMSQVLERAMREDVWPAWLEQINLQDHSLEDLRALGHPYSTRFGANSFVHPDSEVHTQSGELAQSSSIASVGTPQGPAVRLINTSPHYVFLRYGTHKMRMRDPGGVALGLALPLIRKRIATEVKGAIFRILTQ